jgi:hypothetical protein
MAEDMGNAAAGCRGVICSLKANMNIYALKDRRAIQKTERHRSGLVWMGQFSFLFWIF